MRPSFGCDPTGFQKACFRRAYPLAPVLLSSLQAVDLEVFLLLRIHYVFLSFNRQAVAGRTKKLIGIHRRDIPDPFHQNID